MAINKKIAYQDKVGVEPKTVAINQWQDDDCNEVKSVVNNNADVVDENNTLRINGDVVLQNQIDALATGALGSLAIADVPTQDGVYIAEESGTYINAGNLVVDLSSTLTYISISGSLTTFTKIEIPISSLGYSVISSLLNLDDLIVGGVGGNWIVLNDIDFATATKTLPSDVTLYFNGGKFSNGTLLGNNTVIKGYKGLNKDIVLDGTFAGQSILFDWFDCEYTTESEYTTFQGTSSAYGAIPTISNTNSTILKMLFDNRYEVRFNGGIYPFDTAIVSGIYNLQGNGKDGTLLWFPNSGAFTANLGQFSTKWINLSIEAKNNVWLSSVGHTYHSPNFIDCQFISYEDDVFKQTGGTVYDCLFQNVEIKAGEAKSAFLGMGSNSNTHINVSDAILFFGHKVGLGTKSGIMKAFLYNSSTKLWSGSNIAYSTVEYVQLIDIAGLFYGSFENNTFESNSSAFESIVKTDTLVSNYILTARNNAYIGGSLAKENGYNYILLGANKIVNAMDDDQILYGDSILNASSSVIRTRGILSDSGGTKYRLYYLEPNSYSILDGNQGEINTLTPSVSLADDCNFTDLYTTDSAIISFIVIKQSLFNHSYNLPIRNVGLTNGMYRNATESENILSYSVGGTDYNMISGFATKLKVISTKAEYDYYHSAGVSNALYIIIGDIDIGGGVMSVRTNLTFFLFGGSINNGTITSNSTTRFINWNGTATVNGAGVYGTSASGATAYRPTTTNLRIGHFYFDTTLVKPIWWSGSNWVDATGTTV